MKFNWYRLIVFLLALFTIISGLLGNIAANQIPTALQPYLGLAWPLFGFFAFLFVVLSLIQPREEQSLQSLPPQKIIVEVKPPADSIAPPAPKQPEVAKFLPPAPCYAHSYPLQAHFTGRARERVFLSEWLTRGERHTEPALVVEAIGGMGKSALAWYWLHNDILPLNTEYWALTGLFWWSFYDERDFGAFLTRALDYASGGAIIAKTISSDREKLDALVALVRQKRFLFILDGFERVLRAYARMDAAYRGDEVDKDARDDYRACADPNIGVFLKQVACGGCLSKFLITSRLFPRELDELAGVRHLPLTGMDAADAVAFFQAQKIHGTRAETEVVCADYGFHPLTLRLLAGTLARDPRYRADIRNAPRVNPLEQEKERKILDLAYNSLPPREQKLLSQLAAFRSPLKWETIAAIFAQPVIASREAAKQSPLRWLEIASSQKTLLAMTQDELAAAITDLRERGLYLHDEPTDTYDLHPVIRRYCYDRLSDRAATHARFATYFAKVETPQKIQTLADLQPTIELYHHTVCAGRHDEAARLFNSRIWRPLYYQLGAYQIQIDILRALLPDCKDKPPRLKDESLQAKELCELANAYTLVGLPRPAIPYFMRAKLFAESSHRKEEFAIGLMNIASMAQLPIGELKAAEQNLRFSIKICHEIKDERNEAMGHEDLGRVLLYCGEFTAAEKELSTASELYRIAQDKSVVFAYRALRALLMDHASAALAAGRKARRFAEEWARTQYPVERDLVRAEWLIGAALVAGMTPTPTLPRSQSFGSALLRSGRRTGEGVSPLPLSAGLADGGRAGDGGAEAERHLQEALSRDRKIGLVELEAAILLEFAKLRKAQSVDSRQSTVVSRQTEPVDARIV